MKKDPRVDAYIAKAQPFAQPILAEVRKRVEKANPAIEETIKWNVPFFLLGDKIVASTAAFKKHVKVGVWIGKQANFQDVTDVSELIAGKDFATQLAAAIQESGSAMKSAPSKKAAVKTATATKPPAKKTSAKKAPAQPAAPTKKAGSKKAPVTKAPAQPTAPVKKAGSRKAPTTKAPVKKAAGRAAK